MIYCIIYCINTDERKESGKEHGQLWMEKYTENFRRTLSSGWVDIHIVIETGIFEHTVPTPPVLTSVPHLTQVPVTVWVLDGKCWETNIVWTNIKPCVCLFGKKWNKLLCTVRYKGQYSSSGNVPILPFEATVGKLRSCPTSQYHCLAISQAKCILN